MYFSHRLILFLGIKRIDINKFLKTHTNHRGRSSPMTNSLKRTPQFWPNLFPYKSFQVKIGEIDCLFWGSGGARGQNFTFCAPSSIQYEHFPPVVKDFPSRVPRGIWSPKLCPLRMPT